jgi:hypothetical protein
VGGLCDSVALNSKIWAEVEEEKGKAALPVECFTWTGHTVPTRNPDCATDPEYLARIIYDFEYDWIGGVSRTKCSWCYVYQLRYRLPIGSIKAKTPHA